MTTRERETLNPYSIPVEVCESRDRAERANLRASRLRRSESVGASLPDRPVPAHPEAT